MNYLFSALLLLTLSLTGQRAWAQVPEPDSTEIWVIETQAGSLYKGHIVKMESLSVTLKTTEGATVTLAREIIEKMYRAPTNSDIRRPRNLINRYNISSSGYSMGKNKGYYRNNTFFLNELVYGVGDYFDLQISTTFIFTPIILSGKYSIPLVENKVTAAVRGGTIVIPYLNGGDGPVAGYIFGGNLTFGPRNRNVSLGYSTLGPSVFDDTRGNLLSISGAIDLSAKISLVADALFFWEPNTQFNNRFNNQERFSYVSFGTRWRFRSLSLDVTGNFIINRDDYGVFVVPFPSASITAPF